MAIEDAACLAQQLTAENNIVESALQQYERQRKVRTSRVQEGARDNAKLFHLRASWKRFFVYGLMAVGSRLFKRLAYNRLKWLYGYRVD